MRVGLQEAYHKIGIESIYDHQLNAWKLLNQGNNLILAAGTGAGKTEAILLPAIVAGFRIILVYPTKALLQDQVPRVHEVWQSLYGRPSSRSISIDTGDDNDETLFRADVILTTIDKLLYRVFGYGSARWGYIYPWRIAQSRQKRTLLVFDEAHSYDSLTLTHFLFLVDKLPYERRIQTVVLSATLPQALTNHLIDTQNKVFPRANDEETFFKLIDEKSGEVKRGIVRYCGHLKGQDEIVEKALSEYKQNRQVIIVANRVYPTSSVGGQGCSIKELWHALQNKLGDAASEDLILYHGHQFPNQRQQFLKRLKERDDSRKHVVKPYILITTKAFEVGVNVSCDVMLCEMCNPDSFIQRIGRCARRMRKSDNGVEEPENGEVYTFGEISKHALPEEIEAQRRLAELLHQNEGLDLDANTKAKINAFNVFDATLLARHRNTVIYAVDSALYDYVYNFVATGAEMWRKGVLVTRDWVPSLEIQPDGADSNERLKLSASYSVPRELVKGWWFEARDADGRPIRIHGKKVIEQLQQHGIGIQDKAVNAYHTNLVLWLKPEALDDVFGLRERQFVYTDKKFSGQTGMRKCQAKPLPDAPALFWYEPEEEA